MVENPRSGQSGQPKSRPRSVRAVIKLADSALSAATSPDRQLQAILAEVGGGVPVRGPNRHGRAVVSVPAGVDVDALQALD